MDLRILKVQCKDEIKELFHVLRFFESGVKTLGVVHRRLAFVPIPLSDKLVWEEATQRFIPWHRSDPTGQSGSRPSIMALAKLSVVAASACPLRESLTKDMAVGRPRDGGKASLASTLVGEYLLEPIPGPQGETDEQTLGVEAGPAVDL